MEKLGSPHRDTNLLFTQESTDGDKEDLEVVVDYDTGSPVFLRKDRGKDLSEEINDEMDVDTDIDRDEDEDNDGGVSDEDDDDDDYDDDYDGRVSDDDDDGEEDDDDVERIDDTFYESGRHHHSQIPPGQDEFHYYKNEKYVKTEWAEMNDRINGCSELWEEKRRMLDWDVIAKTCEEVLGENPEMEQFYEDIEEGKNWSIKELKKLVRRITKKPLKYFLRKGRHYKVLRDGQCSFVGGKKDKLRLAHRMLKYLCNHCYYCKGIISVYDAEEWYGVHFEHLPGKGKKEFDIMTKVGGRSVADHRKEVRKCATVCCGCNPRGEHGKYKRTYPIDRKYLPVIINAEDKQYRTVKWVIEYPSFQTFLKRAEAMNFLHSTELNQDGTAKGGKIVGTFYDLKMLIWTHFGVLLEDIVYWRKMTDRKPVILFYIAMTNLIKILCNKCAGCDERSCDQKTRNTPPHRLGEFHFDHYPFNDLKDEEVNLLIQTGCELERLLEELKKCTVRCAKCHKGR
ncbi:hypothetical protein ACHAWC_008393 [Mediolabrus comicus]